MNLVEKINQSKKNYELECERLNKIDPECSHGYFSDFLMPTLRVLQAAALAGAIYGLYSINETNESNLNYELSGGCEIKK